MTHGEQPWRRADLERSPGGSVPIRPEWIRQYFRAQDRSDDDRPVIDIETMRRFVEGAEDWLNDPAEIDSVERLRALARGHA